MIILDTSAVTAFATGHRKLHRLISNAAASPFEHLLVPALCLMAAEITDEGAAGRILGLPVVEIEPLDAAQAATVGTMIRDGYGSPETCHAIAASLPTPLRPTQLLILTDRQEEYPPGIITVSINDPRLDG